MPDQRCRAGRPLLERQMEEQAFAEVVAATKAGSGALVVVEGEAGIGKSSLIDLAEALAVESGLMVLKACGSALEQHFAFGVVRQLFERHLRGLEPNPQLDPFAGAATLAAPIFGLGDPAAASGFGADGAYAAQHGLYWLTVNLAAEMPVLLAVDDVQWADEASLRWLHYLARRLMGVQVAVLLARRLSSGSPHARLLDELSAVPGALVIAPAPLSETATVVLCGEVLTAEADAAFARACHEATGGNPFLLGELLHTLASDRVAPRSVEAGRVRALGPSAVADAVDRRLSRLAPVGGGVAVAVAVLDVDAELRHVASLAELQLAVAEAAVDQLVDARILEGGYPLRFHHPVVRAVVYDAIPPGRRNRAHRAAALLVHAEPDGVTRAAAHLLAVEPMADPWVVECLLSAAAAARATGAADAAIELLERARREAAASPEVLLALGRTLRLAGRHAEATACLEEALGALPAGEQAAHVARELAVVMMAQERGREALAILDAQIAEASRAPRELRLRLEADRAWIGLATDHFRRETAQRLDSVESELIGDSPAERVLLGGLAALRAYEARGPAKEVAAVAERALAGGRLLHDQTAGMFTYGWTAQVLLQCDRDDLAEAHLAAGLRTARQLGAGPTVGVLQLALGRVALHRGEVAEAEADARAALELVGHPYARHTGHALLAAALLERGEVEEARAAIAASGVDDRALSELAIGQTLLAVRVALRLAQSRPADAAADAEQLLERLERKGHGGLRQRAVAALAMLAAGDRDRARELAERELAVALRWGAPSATGCAQRVVGLATGGERGLELLGAAATTLRSTPCRLELAKVLTDLGAALRRARQRQAARPPLRQALDLAHRCRAEGLAERARTELLACGARPRRLVLVGVDSLTPSERRVAELAAQGLTNPEVAQALFITRRTVETHLSAVYRKLDITTRADLPSRLARSSGTGLTALGEGRFARASDPASTIGR